MSTLRLPVIVVPKSANAKLGANVATTYTGTESCPSECPLKGGHGCYYEEGFRTRGINNRLNEASAGLAPLDIAQAEASAIDAVKPRPGRALRLHTGGDCRTPDAAQAVAGAAARWQNRGGGRAWSYTHAWRSVGRRSWGAVSILASVESVTDGKRALRAGYAPARVVRSFPNGPRSWSEGGVQWIPCPAQTRDEITCESCRLCWNADDLRNRNAGIAFEAHGSSAKKARACVQDD